jgi:leader peptidase (prepilin peptidase)/N-methyltransferase
VEAAVALLSMAAWKDTVLAAGTLELVTVANYLASFAFCWTLVVVAFIDLDTQLVPSGVTGVVAAVGLAAHLTLPGGQPTAVAIGTAIGFGAVWTLNHGYRLIRGQPGMGMGDAFIMAMVGAHLGWQGVLFTFSAGAVQLLAVQLTLHAASRSSREEPIPLLRRAVPLGPFLAAGALEFYVLGDRLDPLFGAF